MHIKPGTLTVGMVKNDLKGTRLKDLLQVMMHFQLCFQSKEHQHTPMVKQLKIRTYFLTLPCAELGWGELSYIINKLSNLGLSDGEIKN